MSINAFKRLMDSSRKVQSGPPQKRMKNEEVSEKSKSSRGSEKQFWKSGLNAAMNDADNIIDSSENIVIIKDKYPKATFHYLVMPKLLKLNSPKELTKMHIDLLKEMAQKASGLTKNLHPNVKFKIGFHAKPSMDHLHLHVLSTDFLSPCLKTKKHWNSFNTEHFLNLSELISKLEDEGELNNYPRDEDIELYLKKPLRCNQCSFEPKTMPSLKTHLESHANQANS